jgi:hypothetical protein
MGGFLPPISKTIKIIVFWPKIPPLITWGEIKGVFKGGGAGGRQNAGFGPKTPIRHRGEKTSILKSPIKES